MAGTGTGANAKAGARLDAPTGAAGGAGTAALRTQYVKYIAALLLFGTNGLVASRIDLDSLQTTFMRTLLGGALMAAVALAAGALRRRGRTRRDRRYLRDLRDGAGQRNRSAAARDVAFVAVSGMCMGISWMFQYEAFRHIGVGVTSLVYCIGPVIVLATSPLLFSERFVPKRAIWFAVALAGVVFVNCGSDGGSLATGTGAKGGGDAAGKGSASGGGAFGMFCAVMCAVAYAAMVAFNKRARSLNGIDNSAVQIVSAFATTAVCCGALGRLPFEIPAASVGPTLLLGLVNTGIGCYLYFSAINALPAQSVAVCDYIEPLSATVLAGVFLGETLAQVQAAGAALVVCGALGSELAGRERVGKGRSDGRRGDEGGIAHCEFSATCRRFDDNRRNSNSP